MLLLLGVPGAAVPLAERLVDFPAVGTALSLDRARGELVYPDWFAGLWQVETTLVDLAAPQGEKLINPQAFAASRKRKDKSVTYLARFLRNQAGQVVADQRFNTRAVAEAYFGPKNVLFVEIGPNTPNRQVVELRGERRIELVTLRRRTEEPGIARFDVAEFAQQVTTGGRIPNLRGIETVSLYRRLKDTIAAEQLSSVYLDPREPNYFESGGRAVLVYRYRLTFRRVK